MGKSLLLLFITVLLSFSKFHAQQISFSATISDSIVTILEEDKLVSKLIFYVSDVRLNTKDSIIKIKDYHLVDFSDTTSLVLGYDEIKSNQEVESIEFLFGIDSTTSVSGAFGGALDPINGMYWSWQSGYVNFKMEGNLNQEEYVLHLGGYAFPYKSVQKVVLPVKSAVNDYQIILPLDKLFKEAIPEDRTVMSPSEQSVKISKQIASYFYLR